MRNGEIADLSDINNESISIAHMELVLQRLSDTVTDENIIRDCEMSKHTSFKAGGRAFALVMPRDERELRETLALLYDSGVKYMIIGNGSNILVKDSGYSGVIVKIGGAFSRVEMRENAIVCGAGTFLAEAAKFAMDAGLSGLEFASGIPGSIGGAVFMNAGAYGGEMAEIVSQVRMLSKDGKNEYILSGNEMKFDYRYSVLQETDDVALEVTLTLREGKRHEIREKMNELTRLRNEKQPVSMPSAGSFFKRPAGHFAGKLIQDAGLTGLSVGGAAVSTLHAGFIVNRGDATATDIINLMCLIKQTVYDKFGVCLKEEVRIIGD